MAILKQNTAYNRMFQMRATGTTGPKTAAAPVVNISKNGGAFATAAGTVTEVTLGWYYVQLTGAGGDTGTLGDIAFHITGTGADPVDFTDQVCANILGDAFTLTSAYDFAKGTVAVAESYAANTVAPTPVQALLAIHQMLMSFVISGTTIAVKKLDNSTAAFSATMDSATTPAAVTRT